MPNGRGRRRYTRSLIPSPPSTPSNAAADPHSPDRALPSAPPSLSPRTSSSTGGAFDTNAKVVNGEKYLDAESFINVTAPKGGLTRIGRSQSAILFRIAGASRRGLVSWEDFTIFETLLKRPDANYWMAFQYFAIGLSGYIDYNEFKTVFSANLGPDAIPFDFDWSDASAAPLSPHSLSACSDWIQLYLGKKSGSHVLGCKDFIATRGSARS
ncbi:hypothetical protein BJ912DRAFT_1126419 [Pholiota molesta]|nr:hypothetical protein BJ912DRAFT_1126419 [Pholiota molesta]